MKENNCIYKGIASIKYCNSEIADCLLKLSKNHYNDFIELLKDIKEQKVIDTGLYGIVRHPMYAATILLFVIKNNVPLPYYDILYHNMVFDNISYTPYFIIFATE